MNIQNETKIRENDADTRRIQLENRGRVGTAFDEYIKPFLFPTITLTMAIIGSYYYLFYTMVGIQKDHVAMAQELQLVKSEGSVPTKVLETEFMNLSSDIKDIKTSQLRFEDKLDNFSSERLNFTPVR